MRIDSSYVSLTSPAQAKEITIREIPEEILCLIFGKLSLDERAPLRLTCRKFLRVSDDLARTIHLHSFLSRINGFVNLRSVSISSAVYLSSPEFKQLSLQSPRITKLKLEENQLVDKDFIGLFPIASRLEELDLSQSQVNGFKFFTQFLSLCKNLKVLKVDNIPLNSDHLEAIAKNCKNLEVFSWALNNRAAQQDCCESEGLIDLLQNSPSLTSINLSGRIITQEILDALTQCPISSINFSNCIELHELDLKKWLSTQSPFQHLNVNNTEIDDETLYLLSKHQRQLRSLDCSLCVNLTSNGFDNVLTKCTELVTFNASNTKIRNSNLTTLSQHCLKLEVLVVNHCPQLSSGFEDVFKTISSLRLLSAAGCRINDKGLTALSKVSQQLEYLDISECHRLTSVGFAALFSQASALKTLDASLTAIQDNDLEILSYYSPKLEEIHLNECDLLSPVGFGLLFTGCSSLKIINVVGTAITDENLIVVSSTNIEELHISKCTQVTSWGAQAIFKKSPNLIKLHASETKLKDIDLDLLTVSCPKIETLILEFMPSCTTRGLLAAKALLPRLVLFKNSLQFHHDYVEI